ncbi:hypothetical protein V1477_005132 [Vespula maculifrons]|uniref:Uncharacterized protein n=1 Tax=Vespula maculifrons TaxID=7453 RepID=A0ABD2CNS7_VESMC
MRTYFLFRTCSAARAQLGNEKVDVRDDTNHSYVSLNLFLLTVIFLDHHRYISLKSNFSLIAYVRPRKQMEGRNEFVSRTRYVIDAAQNDQVSAVRFK